MKKMLSLFSGGGLYDVGARSAGFTPVFGVEYDAKIADVYRQNVGNHIIVNRVEDVDYSALGLNDIYLAHASPECKRASTANQETENEIDLAQSSGVIKMLRDIRPQVFTLENVYGYRKFQSFKNILACLSDLGYRFDENLWHLNSADYGVPQTRMRMILIARLDGRLSLAPTPTHYELKQGRVQMFGRPWVGWYEAIEDIVDTLPDDKLANWQVKLLPDILSKIDDFGTSFIVEGTAAGDNNKVKLPVRTTNEPVFTVRTGNSPRALLIDGGNTSGTKKYRLIVELGSTITSSGGYQRAVLIDGQTNQYGTSITTRANSEHRFTIGASQDKRPIKALLESGKVVKITPRALARFQSVPDSYILPLSNQLAKKIVGNGVPCLLAQRLCESIK